MSLGDFLQSWHPFGVSGVGPCYHIFAPTGLQSWHPFGVSGVGRCYHIIAPTGATILATLRGLGGGALLPYYRTFGGYNLGTPSGFRGRGLATILSNLQGTILSHIRGYQYAAPMGATIITPQWGYHNATPSGFRGKCRWGISYNHGTPSGFRGWGLATILSNLRGYNLGTPSGFRGWGLATILSNLRGYNHGTPSGLHGGWKGWGKWEGLAFGALTGNLAKALETIGAMGTGAHTTIAGEWANNRYFSNRPPHYNERILRITPLFYKRINARNPIFG